MNIVSLPIVVDKDKIDSRFRMVVLSTERARQIMHGAKPTTPSKYIKSTTIALEEISDSQVQYVTGKEARKAMQEAAAKRLIEEMGAPKEEVEEDETKKEIEKDLGVYVPEEGETKESEGTE